MGDTGQIEDLTHVLNFVHKELMLLRKIQETKLTSEQADEYRRRIERNGELKQYREFEGQ